MPKLQQNIVMFKGDDLPIEFLHVGPTWQTNREVLALQPDDDAEWRMCDEAPSEANAYNPTVVLSKTKTAGGITFYASGMYIAGNDIIKVQLDSADTDESATGIPPAEYYHELIIKYAGIETTVVSSGFIDLRSPAGKRT